MDKRQALILERSIRDYIQTGKPITSGHLYRRHRFGIKPAMIRRELNALSDADYFSQVHHSGGRVPTLKAYRFFVEQLKHEAFGEAPFMSDVFSFMQKGALQELVAFLAEELRLVSVIYDPEEDALYRSGLEALCASQDIFGKDMLLSVIRDIGAPSRRALILECRGRELAGGVHWEKSVYGLRCALGRRRAGKEISLPRRWSGANELPDSAEPVTIA